MKNKIKILITGGFGFVGSSIVNKLLKKKNKFKIFVIDNLSRIGSENNYYALKEKVKFFKYDIGYEKKKIEDLIKKIKPDHLFHLAGQVAMSNSLKNPYHDFIINTLGTLNILESIRKYSKNTQLIFASSNKVYGDLKNIQYYEKKYRYETKKRDFSEDTPLNFSTPYGCSKGSADQYVLDYSKVYNLNFTVFRHSTIYGPKQFFDYNQGWISWFCEKLINQKNSKSKIKFSVSGNGKQVRDILHIDDAAELYLKSIRYKKRLAGKVFNVGGGFKNSISILELIKYLEKKLKVKSYYFNIKERTSDQKYFACNISSIKNSIQWYPKVSLYKGLDDLLKNQKI